MGWLGMLIGSYVGGSALRGGPLLQLLGAIAGAVLGSKVEDSVRGKRRPLSGADVARNQSMVFCGSVAAMLAKMAKADGHITSEEIASAEHAFERMGFTGEKRDYCIDIFRKAKDDAHSIYDYAADFARVQKKISLRVVFYDLLWELAAADGTVSSYEVDLLKNIPGHLRISAMRFAYQYARYCGDGSRSGSSSSSSGGGHRPPPPRRDELAEAYELLGCSPSATDEELKKAYRAKAKQYHPDEMVAKGLPPELVKKATEEMARINAAYDLIRKSRR